MSCNYRKLRIGFANLLMLGNFEKEAEEKAVKHSNDAKKYLEDLGARVFSNLSAVTNLDEANKTWKYFKENDVDAVVLFSGTFSLGNLMTEIIRNLDVPFLAWGLEEYLIKKGVLAGSMIGLMPTGAICRNMDKKFSFAYGTMEKGSARDKVKIFLNAIRAIAYMKEARIGLIGSRPDGFEVAGFDELAIKRIFGTTINKISMPYFLDLIDNIDKKEIDLDMAIQKNILTIKDKDIGDARSLSSIYIAIKKIVKEYDLKAYAPQCWPELRMDRKTPMCTANGRITAEGIMASCEADMDCTLTMLLLHAFKGNTPWTADFVNIIKEKDSILFWHCGNASHTLSDQKPKIEVVFEGLAQTASLRPGIATVCRVNHYKGSFEIHAGVGEVIESKPMLKGSNMFIRMAKGNMEFVQSMLDNGVPHHNVIVYGDLSEEIKIFANLTGLPVKIIK